MNRLPDSPPEPPRYLPFKTVFVLLSAIAVSIVMTATVYDLHGKYVKESISEFGRLPTRSVQALSFEFKGVVADYLFFKTLTFLGLKIGERSNPTPEEWGLIHQMLQRVTDLDGRFWDPYVFAEMTLAWQAGMLEEANQLLHKATVNRPEDYRPPYFIGFNHFYFKKDAVKAAPHFRAAAMAPGAPDYIKGLAARVSLYGRQTALGISFLEDLMKETQDPKLVAYLQKRLTALQMLGYLEQKVLEFKKRNGELPKSLADLVAAGLIPSIPEDPYGGTFTLLENGRVYTTSELIGPEKHKKNTQPLSQ
jgi:hypothetical protein